jgi:hypothetical protein
MKFFTGGAVPALARTGLLVGVSACCLVLSGCALWAKDKETAAICGRGFVNDLDWTRAWPLARSARTLRKKFPTIEFEGQTDSPSRPTTVWYKNSRSSEFASCSRHSCGTSRCLWRVRLYSKADDQWRIRLEYDLGRPRH